MLTLFHKYIVECWPVFKVALFCFFNRFPSLVQWVMRQECAQPSAERRRKEEVFIFEAFNGFSLLICEFYPYVFSRCCQHLLLPKWTQQHRALSICLVHLMLFCSIFNATDVKRNDNHRTWHRTLYYIQSLNLICFRSFKSSSWQEIIWCQKNSVPSCCWREYEITKAEARVSMCHLSRRSVGIAGWGGAPGETPPSHRAPSGSLPPSRRAWPQSSSSWYPGSSSISTRAAPCSRCARWRHARLRDRKSKIGTIA